MFDRAVALVLDAEGVFSDDPHDRGGATKYGISQRAYPGLDIRSLTRDQAIALYRGDYWDACRCGQMPWWAALTVFDAAVNQGPGVAAIAMQRALGLVMDGVIGSKTLAAIAGADPASGLALYLTERTLHYVAAADWPRYGRGWTRRLYHMQAAALVGAP
jgi:lysozyme family protein